MKTSPSSPPERQTRRQMDRQTHTPKMYDFSCGYTVRSQCTPHELMWIVLPQHRPVPQVALLQSEKDGNRREEERGGEGERERGKGGGGTAGSEGKREGRGGGEKGRKREGRQCFI